jgi:P pilus assembly chaperone PapD
MLRLSNPGPYAVTIDRMGVEQDGQSWKALFLTDFNRHEMQICLIVI